MKEYKGIIDKLIKDSYEESLVIDVFNDKIYKYAYVNDDIVKLEELSYADYLNKCNSFIYGDDLDKYIESLSIGNDTNVVRYKMLDESGNYQEYVNNIIKYKDDGNDLIVVLVAKDKDLDNIVSNNTNSISNMENKLKRMVDSIGNAILKIHNVINNGGSVNNKKECIEAILAGIVNEYPEFNEVINSNMNNLFLQKKSTIMIIDDDKMTCSLIKKIFDKDYDIIIANNGKEAIEYLSDNDNSSFKANIACIFLDLLMPVLDGFSVLDYLNDNNYLNKLPVIIISGNYDKETRNRAYSYQIADMLEKPFNVQVVRHRIEKMINLYKSSSSINNMMIEQHRELKNIANSLIVSYEIDNEKMMKMVKKYTRILAIQVSVDYKEYNIFISARAKLEKSFPICLGGGGAKNFPCDILRVGIGLYGYGDDMLKKVMTLEGKVLQIRTLEKGERAGYGGSFKASKPTTLAIVSVGYADGFERVGSKNLEVKIDSKKFKIVGRTCMDACFVDITGGDVKVGQSVTVMDDANVLSKKYKKSTYEILTSFTKFRGERKITP